MSGHTSGDWTTKIRQPGTMLTVENERGEYVCSLLGGDDHKQANAVLIAAAPELLAALVDLINTHTGATWQTAAVQREAWTAAADAIARATGTSA